MGREIDKKILPEFFESVLSKRKTFELRKDEDDIQVGDVLVLREWNAIEGYTGQAVRRVVTYVLRDAEEYGLMHGYCIIGMHPPIEETAVAVDAYAQASDVVPWDWLKRYAQGRRMNYCSDFVLEAREAWKNEQDIH